MYPHAGGDYVYLREAYHPVAGFLVGWLSFFVIYAGTVATLAVGLRRRARALRRRSAPAARSALAVAITIATSWINYVGVRTGARVNNVTAAIKIVALAGLARRRAAARRRQPRAPRSRCCRRRRRAAGRLRPGAVAGAVQLSRLERVGVRRQRDPRSRAATCRARCSSASASARRSIWCVNVVYLYALPIDALRGDVRVGEAAARVFFGAAGGTIGAALILASIVELPERDHPGRPAHRLRDGARRPVLRAASTACTRAYQTPHVAIVAQALTAIALIVVLLQRFPSVLDYTTFAIVLATMADTTALYALRRRQPRSAAPLPRLGLSAGAGALPDRQRRHRRARCCAAGRSSAPSPWPSPPPACRSTSGSRGSAAS